MCFVLVCCRMNIVVGFRSFVFLSVEFLYIFFLDVLMLLQNKLCLFPTDKLAFFARWFSFSLRLVTSPIVSLTHFLEQTKHIPHYAP